MPNHQASYNSKQKIEPPEIMSKYFRQIHQFAKIQIDKDETSFNRITIQKNTQINRGDIIGLVGKAGQTTGYHLHYEIRRNNRVIDPLLYFYPEKQILD